MRKKHPKNQNKREDFLKIKKEFLEVAEAISCTEKIKNHQVRQRLWRMKRFINLLQKRIYP